MKCRDSCFLSSIIVFYFIRLFIRHVRGCIIHVHLQIYVVYITKIKLIRYLCVVYVGMNGGVGKRPARLDLNLPMVPSDAVIVREVA